MVEITRLREQGAENFPEVERPAAQGEGAAGTVLHTLFPHSADTHYFIKEIIASLDLLFMQLQFRC